MPFPTCMIPTCFNIRNDVLRMRQVEKKIKNDLNYLWLVKYVDNIFNLSSGLFERLQAKNLSLVFVKEKLDENQKVRPPVEVVQALEENDFIDYNDINNDNDIQDAKELLPGKKKGRVLNESSIMPQDSR